MINDEIRQQYERTINHLSTGVDVGIVFIEIVE